jgi:hypothetical protein
LRGGGVEGGKAGVGRTHKRVAVSCAQDLYRRRNQSPHARIREGPSTTASLRLSRILTTCEFPLRQGWKRFPPGSHQAFSPQLSRILTFCTFPLRQWCGENLWWEPPGHRLSRRYSSLHGNSYVATALYTATLTSLQLLRVLHSEPAPATNPATTAHPCTAHPR